MLILRNIIDSVSGLRFIVEKLDFRSSLGKRFLLSQEFLTDEQQMVNELSKVTYFIQSIQEYRDIIEQVCVKLEQIRDIHGTIKNLGNAATLDDIELFEIKHFSLIAQEIRVLLKGIGCPVFIIPDLEPIIEILDPEQQRLPHFYIYPLYSRELAALRIKYNAIKADQPELAEELRMKCLCLEDKIRQDLSLQLIGFNEPLTLALHHIAAIDISIAKAKLALLMNFSKPEIGTQDTEYTGLFHPQVKEVLQNRHKDFQPLDIRLNLSPCLITGANMGGKTVLLKTVALSQYLFQFGFYVPATHAKIVPVDEIIMSMGDDQSELNGLSSFAAEMLHVNHIIKSIKSGKKILALIDELARTTNPEEGMAIVDATLCFLEKNHVRSLVTTHYSGLQTQCRKLRVKGLVADRINERITIENINDFMDYSLIENTSDAISKEAINIARVLGVDEELLQEAEESMRK